MIFNPGDMTGQEFPCEIIKSLSGGHMAELYLAQVKNTNHLVVVKEVSGKATQLQKETLLREGQILQQVRMEGIPEFYGYFEEQGRCYYIMSYHKGMDLEQYMLCHKSISEKLTLQIAVNTCRILAYLHQKGIVYGDLKPSNLLLEADGNITLLDFGAAEFMDQARKKIYFQGTLGYAAPECWHRGEITLSPATDIFALGATLFYLLEGREPRECYGNFVLSGDKTQKKNRWQSVLNKCCALDTRNRYRSAAEVYKDISQIRL